jgi:hypothetical protein
VADIGYCDSISGIAPPPDQTESLGFTCEFLATHIFSALIARITARNPSSSSSPTLKEYLLQHAQPDWEVLDLLQGEAER